MSDEKQRKGLLTIGQLEAIYFVFMCVMFAGMIAFAVINMYNWLIVCAAGAILSCLMFSLYVKVNYSIAIYGETKKQVDEAVQALLATMARGMLNMVKEKKAKVDKQMKAFDKSYKKAKKEHDKKRGRPKKTETVVAPKKRGRPRKNQ